MCARACGARIVSRTDELREEDVGTGARLFEVKKIGDEYFAFITDCRDPKACTIVLRGASKEILAVSYYMFCIPSHPGHFLGVSKSFLTFEQLLCTNEASTSLLWVLERHRIPILWAVLFSEGKTCIVQRNQPSRLWAVLSAGGVLQFPATNKSVLSCLLQEVERNLQDAMQVCRNVLIDPQLVPGGGATEMAVSHALTEKSKGMTGVEQWPYRAVAQALEVIPRTLIQNCGASTIRVLTSLRVRHVAQDCLEEIQPFPAVSYR